MEKYEKLLINQRKEYNIQEVGYTYLQDFGCYLTIREKRVLQNFLYTLDFADQAIENSGDTATQTAIMKYLVGHSAELPAYMPDNVVQTFYSTREYVADNNLGDRLIVYIEQIILHRKRRVAALSATGYIYASIDEAVSTAECMILFLPKEKMSSRLVRFLHYGNIALRFIDDHYDIEQDYDDGKMSFVPDAKMKNKIKKSNNQVRMEMLSPISKKDKGARHATKANNKTIIPPLRDYFILPSLFSGTMAGLAFC